MSHVKKPTVLVIDDEADMRMMIGETLKSLDAKLTFATSVSEGKQALSTLSVDIIVCDYRMKDGTGFDVLDFAEDSKIRVPFILCTSMSRDELPRKDLSRLAFINKRDVKQLREKVRSYLDSITQ